jgi:hypothetical protein
VAAGSAGAAAGMETGAGSGALVGGDSEAAGASTGAMPSDAAGAPNGPMPCKAATILGSLRYSTAKLGPLQYCTVGSSGFGVPPILCC